ncbi:DUF4135 domain-containing protein, partial [Pseudomonas syringae]|uniref:DUF4135 domain-containing protein n=1 Tax=Pseudomonas syringae TaxID=317 RepID=UPI00215ACDE1
MTAYTSIFDLESAMAPIDTDCPLYPYLNLYAKKADNLLDRVNGVSADEKKIIVNGFLKSLTQRIMNTANNVLVAEREILATTLSKENISSSDFYQILRNNSDYLQDILTSYPELHRILLQITQNYVDFTIEFCIHLGLDRLELFKLCSVRSGDLITECNVSMGETHKRSRTVVIVRFSNLQQVVYKPRSLHVEECASNLLKFLRSKAATSYESWVIPSYINKSSHGWAQHTGQMPADNEEDVSTFYKRIGFLLGFCTSVTASDITSDNL